ncbi:hypothetical protein DFH08DRAFT_810449 [Mycena albidolilacea]|uniref:Uncharacterized protein n=1 Tax=Mycena albidolilacea TaxID=1033008 RepID=A0AAD7EQP0_9AGAR|nr:hypothetical protein DFH08DRAFT_810449 [Mycena albidolilacea]
MADVVLLESSVPFDVAEWIGVGKLYKDVPIKVSDACCDARTIPADLRATFPSRATPIWRSGYQSFWTTIKTISTQADHWFSFEPPNYDPIPTLWSNSIPALSFLCELENDYPQKWMNGAISVLDPPQKSIRLPLFAVAFYLEIHRLREAQDIWCCNVPGFDGGSDDEDEEEEEYEELEEGSGGQKRKPKPLRGAVKRKKTDGTKQSKSGANKGCQPSVERSRTPNAALKPQKKAVPRAQK